MTMERWQMNKLGFVNFRAGRLLFLRENGEEVGGSMTDEQTEHLRRYFNEEPAWRRQLGQLKKKYLAGYTAGVVSLRDATKAECDAAERLLRRHFTPPQLRYSLSEFEQSLCNSCFAIPTLGDFWTRLEGRPLVPNKQRKEQRSREIADFYAREALYAHGFVAHS